MLLFTAVRVLKLVLSLWWEHWPVEMQQPALVWPEVQNGLLKWLICCWWWSLIKAARLERRFHSPQRILGWEDPEQVSVILSSFLITCSLYLHKCWLLLDLAHFHSSLKPLNTADGSITWTWRLHLAQLHFLVLKQKPLNIGASSLTLLTHSSSLIEMGESV